MRVRNSRGFKAWRTGSTRSMEGKTFMMTSPISNGDSTKRSQPGDYAVITGSSLPVLWLNRPDTISRIDSIPLDWDATPALRGIVPVSGISRLGLSSLLRPDDLFLLVVPLDNSRYLSELFARLGIDSKPSIKRREVRMFCAPA